MLNFESSQEEAERPQEKQVEKAESKIHTFDPVAYGEYKAAKSEGAPLSAQHDVVILNKDTAWKYNPTWAGNGHPVELVLGGTVTNKESGLAETYRHEYVQLPDGTIRTLWVESQFSDGDKETLSRAFNDDGLVTQETDVLNDVLREERQFFYNESGELIGRETRTYDEAGNEVGREEVVAKNGEVQVSRTGKDRAAESLVGKDIKSYTENTLSGKKQLTSTIPGRVLNH